MILYAYTANADLLPENVWLHRAPLFKGNEPEWTACIAPQSFWSYPSVTQGLEPFELKNVPCQCALLPPGVPKKYVEDGEMWIDLDHPFAVDMYGPTSVDNLRAFLASHGVKVTLSRLLTILAMDGKDILKYINKWNKIAVGHSLKQENLSFTIASVAAVEQATPPAAPSAAKQIKTLYDELMAGNIKIKPKLSPYKWVLSKGVVVRHATDKAEDDELEAKLSDLPPNVYF